MTTNQTRTRAAGTLFGHQPDDPRTSATSQYCTCGEQLPRGVNALAVHQVQQLLILDLLRADPTGPLSLRALQDLTAGEVVFDVAGNAWMCCGTRAGQQLWFTSGEPWSSGTTAEDLHADGSPLSMFREPSRGDDPARKCRVCGCTDDNACQPIACFWVRDEQGGNVCSGCVPAGSSAVQS
jgi:hypothetical protein